MMPPLRALAGRGVTLRHERAGDRDFLRVLYAYDRAAELALAPWDDARKAAFLDQQFAAQCAHYDALPRIDRLILLAPRRIGRLYLDRTAAPWVVSEIAIIPDRQGKGLGAALLRRVQSLAGTDGVTLNVRVENRRAIALYARLGFRTTRPAAGDRLRMDWTA